MQLLEFIANEREQRQLIIERIDECECCFVDECKRKCEYRFVDKRERQRGGLIGKFVFGCHDDHSESLDKCCYC